eukprot:2728116-Prymnesium_polylepis.1
MPVRNLEQAESLVLRPHCRLRGRMLRVRLARRLLRLFKRTLCCTMHVKLGPELNEVGIHPRRVPVMTVASNLHHPPSGRL